MEISMQLKVLQDSMKLPISAFSYLSEQLQEYGSNLNDNSEAALKSVLQHMYDMLTGRLHNDHRYFLASIDPGIGKTEAACAFLRGWKGLGFSPAGSVLVALSRREEIKSYIDRAGLAETDFAVMVGVNSRAITTP